MKGLARFGLAALLTFAPACVGGKTEREYAQSAGGDVERGAQVIRAFGCGACHSIPGIRDARGVVASPLTHFSERTYIAGKFPNNSRNLVRWVQNPQALEPGTAMPVLGLDERQARDVAAYLYSLN